MKSLVSFLVVIVLALSIAACDSVAEPPEMTTVSGPTTTRTLDAGTAVGVTAAPKPRSTPSDSTTPTSVSPVLALSADVGIEQTTPQEGNDLYPDLEWEPVEGAGSYGVIVFAPDGSTWWAWSGADTSTILGGVDTEVDLGGPQAGAGVTWAVIAYDDDGAPIATSSPRRVER